MPSGKNHDRITWICLPLIILISLLIIKSPNLTVIVGMAFVFSGLMFGPDLDIYSQQYKRWGWFKFIWRPYQKALKHRSFFSHGFIIGTLIRVLYLFLVLFFCAIFIVAIAQIIAGFSWHWQKIFILSYTNLTNQYPSEALALFVGLELGAMSHYLADEIASRLKASKNKKVSPRQKKTKSRKRRQSKDNYGKSNKRKVIK